MSASRSPSPVQAGVFRSPLRTLLVRLTGRPEDTAVLRYAGDLAAAFGAHAACVHVPSEPPSIAMLAGGEGASDWRGFASPSAETRDERAAKARRQVSVWRAEHGWPISGDATAASVTVGYAELDGDEAIILTERARLSDLAIIARPDNVASVLAFDGLLTGSGRAVLMVPTVPAPEMHGFTVAWNGSVQAARALGAALPLMQALGGDVAVLSVPERHRRSEANDAVEYLRWHGITATVASPSTADVGAQLLDLARERQAGLIVSGAYSHSRLRQGLFGGVTSHLLERAEVPVLLAG